jgi:hypothetical protein
MNKKLNLTKLSKKSLKNVKAGATEALPCLCGCPITDPVLALRNAIKSR